MCFLSFLHFIWLILPACKHRVYFTGLEAIPSDDHLIYLTSVLHVCCAAVKKHSFVDLMVSVVADGWSSSVITKLLQRAEANISSGLHVSVFCAPALLSGFWSVCKWDASTEIWRRWGPWRSGSTDSNYAFIRMNFLAPDSSYFTVAYLITGLFCIWWNRRWRLFPGQMQQRQSLDDLFSSRSKIKEPEWCWHCNPAGSRVWTGFWVQHS